MKKVICTTTINAPTEAIELFDEMPDWTLVVAGDKKTPADYRLKRGIYLSPETQVSYDVALSDAIGWNCIQRRNFAFLYAVKDLGADIIATIDDDNIPLPEWGENLMLGRETATRFHPCSDPAFDPVGVASRHLWHRGFPLQLLPTRAYSYGEKETVSPDIQADFWNGDPDIDAICRMEHAPTCEFHENHFPISSNKPSPFNSQNTFLSAKVMPHYFMFPGIGRMDDIWASYHVQAQGFKVVYGAPSVVQKRNPHNPIIDMKAEYLGYENNLAIVESIPGHNDAVLKFLPERARVAFDLYRRHFE